MLDAIQLCESRLADRLRPDGSLQAMARRNRSDPLQALSQPTWLVVRNKHRQALEALELAAGADLRAILRAARNERIASGWVCDDIGQSCGFFFAVRAGERICVSIERYDPNGPGPPSHSAPG
jgi:hypothetical protein